MKNGKNAPDKQPLEAEHRTAHYSRLTNSETDQVLRSSTNPVINAALIKSKFSPFLSENPLLDSSYFSINSITGTSNYYFANPKVIVTRDQKTWGFLEKANTYAESLQGNEKALLELLITQQIPVPIEIVASHLDITPLELSKIIRKINQTKLAPISISNRNDHLLLTAKNDNPEIIINPETIKAMVQKRTGEIIAEAEKEKPPLKFVPRSLYHAIVKKITEEIVDNDNLSTRRSGLEQALIESRLQERYTPQLDEIIELAIGRIFQATPDAEIEKKFSKMEIVSVNLTQQHKLWEAIAKAQDELGYIPHQIITPFKDDTIEKLGRTLKENFLEIQQVPNTSNYILIRRCKKNHGNKNNSNLNLTEESQLITTAPNRLPSTVKHFIKSIQRDKTGTTIQDLENVISMLDGLDLPKNSPSANMRLQVKAFIQKIINADLHALALQVIEAIEKTPPRSGRTGGRRG